MIYSVSPKHTDEYFAQKTREAASLEVPIICLKDPGGLLTPERMRTLVPVMYENCNGIPIELHTHCTTGLGPLCCLEAMDLGIRSVNTAVPPLADSSSNPSVFNVARNARALGYNPLVDESVLEPVSEHFMTIARREGFPIGKPVEYDYAQYQHQVPGGMLSNLQHQLDKVRLGDRFPQALEESIQVRGRVRLPHHGNAAVPVRGQPGGAQRHRRRPLQGGHRPGDPLCPGGGPARKAPGSWTPTSRTISSTGLGPGRSRRRSPRRRPSPRCAPGWAATGCRTKELLLRWLLSEDEIAQMRAAAPPQAYVSTRPPMVALVEQLARKSDLAHVRVAKGDVSVTLNRAE